MNSKKNLSLRPISSKDTELLQKWRSEQTDLPFNWLDDLTDEELKKRLERTGSDLNQKTFAEYRWIAEDQGQAFGYVILKNINWAMQYGEITFSIADAHQGRGYGTEAAKLLIEHVFSNTLLHKLVVHVHSDNMASQTILRKLGFIKEGKLHSQYIIKNSRVDADVYSILRGDWENQDADRDSYDIEYICVEGIPRDLFLLQDLITLDSAFFGEKNADSYGEELQDKSDLLFVIARAKGKVIGYKVGYRRKQGQFFSWFGGVSDAFRGRSVGSELMRIQHEWCKKKGYTSIQTYTKNKWKQMLMLNLRHGFDIIGSYTDGDHEAKIIFQKSFKSAKA